MEFAAHGAVHIMEESHFSLWSVDYVLASEVDCLLPDPPVQFEPQGIDARHGREGRLCLRRRLTLPVWLGVLEPQHPPPAPDPWLRFPIFSACQLAPWPQCQVSALLLPPCRRTPVLPVMSRLTALLLSWAHLSACAPGSGGVSLLPGGLVSLLCVLSRLSRLG